MNRHFSPAENDRRRAIQRATGLSHRQLELLVGLGAWVRTETQPARLRQLARRLAEREELALITPTMSHPNGKHPPYAGALLRLVKLGMVSYAGGGEIRLTSLGSGYLAALAAGRQRPRDRLTLIAGGA